MTLDEAKKEIEHRVELWRKGLLYVPDGLSQALAILNEVDTEPVGKDRMTLEEFARELRKIFKFSYVTLEGALGDYYQVNFWREKPNFVNWCKSWTAPYGGRVYGWLATDCFSEKLDLSEYEDDNREIDYSKCIVEVEG